MNRLANFRKSAKSFSRPRSPSSVAQSSTSSVLNSAAASPVTSTSTLVSPLVSVPLLPFTPAVLLALTYTIASTVLPDPAPAPAPPPALESVSLSILTPTLPPPESIPSPTLLPAALPPPTPALTGVPAPPAVNTRTLCLWGQALEKLRKKGLQEFRSGHCDIQLVQNLITKVEDTKAECDAKRFSYKNSRGDKVFYVEKFLTKLEGFAFIGDIAIQQNPDTVALVWAGFRLLLEVGIAYTENMGMVSDSLEYLVSVIFCGEIYEKLYSSTGLATAEPLNRSLVDLYAAILEYLWCAEKFLKKKTAIRILESFSSELKKLLESIQKLEAVTRNNADLVEKEAASNNRSEQDHLKVLLVEMRKSMRNIERKVMESYRTIEAMWRYIENEQRLKALRWISDVEYGSHHSEFRNRRHPDTGIWLLQNPKFNDWETLSSSRIFWLRGDVGSGKTMLVSKIIDVLQDKARTNHHALAYFYCYFQESSRSDPKSILRAIVKQLCVAYSEDGLPEPVVSIYEDRERWGHSTGPLDLIESRNIIIELLGKFSHTTIVIDALDECNPKTRGEMFQILKEIVKSRNNVRVFVTSRNEGDIREMLFSMPNHYIDAGDNSEDINKYIRTEVTRLCNERSLLRVDRALKDEIILALEDGAKGMFLWAHLQILAIRDENTPGDIRTALQNLPEDLNATYLNILQRVQKQSKTSYRKAVMVLKWVLCAQGVCAPEAIKQALLFSSTTHLDPDQLMESHQLLDICRNLVIYDKELKVLRFAHFSVEEFLRAQPEYSPEEIHINIAEICLGVLCLNPNLGAQISLVPDLVSYAVSNWGVHLGLSISGSNRLQHLWKKFLQPSSAHYREWTQGIIRTEKNHTLRGEKTSIISPLWVACYYQLYVIFESLLNEKTMPNPRNEYGTTPLSHASEYGYEIFVKRLLEEEGVNVNSKDIYRRTPLSLAAGEGHDKVVQMLLEKEEVDVNSKDIYHRTPLSLAAEKGHDKIVRMLLEKKGVDVDSKDKNGQTLLFWAACNGNEKLLQMLLEKEGVDVNSRDINGQTPLSEAAEKGHDKMVRMLLKKEGVDVNNKDKNGQTPLFWAARNGNEKVLRILLEKEGLDMDSKDINDQTPLFWAARNGNEKVVRILLEKEGLDVNSKGIYHRTPLSLAAEKGHDKIVWMLLEKEGVDVDSKDEFDRTPLLWAVMKAHDKIVRMLLKEERVDVNSKDIHHRTPLSLAAEKGHDEVVQMLLEKEGVDVDSKDIYHRTPLSLAAEKGHDKVVQMLLEKEGVDVNSKDMRDQTPLLWAAEQGHENLVLILLEKGGVDVNSRNKKHQTPLFCAARNGKEKVVRMLLKEEGVDVNSRDINDQTPLSEAAKYKHETVVRILLENGGVDVNEKCATEQRNEGVLQTLLRKYGVRGSQ